MRPRLFLRLSCLAFLVAASLVRASTVGDTYAKVLADNGQPKNIIDAGSVKILGYPGFTIKVRDGLVVSIKPTEASPAAPLPPPAGAGVPLPHPYETTEHAYSRLSAERQSAVDSVIAIVNQPVPQIPMSPNLRPGWWGNGWFHEGASIPDYANVDIRVTQEVVQFMKYRFISSPLNPGVVFPGDQIEFNANTKLYYQDRNLPKKRLTQDEMVEINRLYRVIAKCDSQLALLKGPQ